MYGTLGLYSIQSSNNPIIEISFCVAWDINERDYYNSIGCVYGSDHVSLSTGEFIIVDFS